ncbi:MAG TPA: signal peptidase II [Caulobacteraceae bacterium]|nr:signal peptidase II [Caulobacteraceae bacterium]
MSGPKVMRLQVTRLGLVAYAVAAVTVVADQLSKAWVIGSLRLDDLGSVPILPPFFRLTLVENRGVSFGLLSADTPLGRWMLVAMAGAVVAVLIWSVRNTQRPLFATAIGLVIGGALGNNLIDRARIGRVIDFLDFSGLYFPWVFNVADSAITVGVVLLLLDTLLAPKAAPVRRD